MISCNAVLKCRAWPGYSSRYPRARKDNSLVRKLQVQKILLRLAGTIVSASRVARGTERGSGGRTLSRRHFAGYGILVKCPYLWRDGLIAVPTTTITAPKPIST